MSSEYGIIEIPCYMYGHLACHLSEMLYVKI